MVVGVSEQSDVTQPGVVEGGRFGGRHREVVVLRFSAVHVGVAMETRFRVLEAHTLKIMKEIMRI